MAELLTDHLDTTADPPRLGIAQIRSSNAVATVVDCTGNCTLVSAKRRCICPITESARGCELRTCGVLSHRRIGQNGTIIEQNTRLASTLFCHPACPRASPLVADKALVTQHLEQVLDLTLREGWQDLLQFRQGATVALGRPHMVQ